MKRRSRGEGSIYKRDDDLWVGQIYVDGKKKVKHSKTQKEIREWLHAQNEAVKAGTYLPDEKYTVTSFMERYFKDVAEHTLAPRTVLSYMAMRKHIEPSLGNVKLTQLRVDHLQRLYSGKLNEGLSKRTVQYMHQFLHTVLNVAVKWGLLARNVCDQASPPSQEKEPATVLTASQTKRLLELSQGTNMHLLILCAVTLGMREGELLALDWGCVNWERKTIRVEKQLQYLPGKGLTIKSPKTKSSYRTLPLPEMTYQALYNQFCEAAEKDGLIFHTSHNTPYSPRNILRYFHRLLKKMDLPIMAFHNLRHSCASFHLAAGTNPKVVSELLGHSSVGITLSTYSHVLPGIGEEAASRINGILS